ncbi:MAG: PLD nuclease N-terminal domain-containing protein [Lentisphaerae bacterium]|nr:PLD nuclease N-terminal domain-containing protein [Lentisphaerota bacterium]
MATGEIIIITIIVVILPLFYWMLMDCVLKEPDPKERTKWVLIILLTNPIGALLYLIYRRPLRKKKYGK